METGNARVGAQRLLLNALAHGSHTKMPRNAEQKSSKAVLHRQVNILNNFSFLTDQVSDGVKSIV